MRIYRPPAKKFSLGLRRKRPGCVLLKEVLAEQIVALADGGVIGWLSGMALGADLWAAEIMLALREKNPALTLHCVLPCEGQDRKWPASAREQYRSILERADETILVSRTYDRDCMLRRNRYMVDRSSMLLAVYNGTRRSGTGATVNYAQKLGREIIVIDPVFRTVGLTPPTAGPPGP